MNPKRIRVLVVDDSALVRRVLTDTLDRFPDIQVVGTATDPVIARDKIRELQPDVLTLDIEMPRMDGLSFLRLLMQHRPMPAIILSSLTGPGSEKALEALQAGAVAVLGKPNGPYSVGEDLNRLAETIRAAAVSRLRRPSAAPGPAPRPGGGMESMTRRPPVPTAARGTFHPRQLILLGASTGGTEALAHVLPALGADLPGICIVQHIPSQFSRAFAERLDRLCTMEVREARSGDSVHAGLALVAPGGYHMVLRWTGSHYAVELNQGPSIHHQRPAADILFDSAARAGAGPFCTAALLTGMGADGAAGLLRLRQAGAHTIAQNEDTCVVYGMPKEAVRLGAAEYVEPLERIAPRLERLVRSDRTTRPSLSNPTIPRPYAGTTD